MAATLGWLSRAAARASCSSRRRASGAVLTGSASVFSATRRWRRGSSARYTSPIAPAPSFSRIRYGPTHGAARPTDYFLRKSCESLACPRVERLLAGGRDAVFQYFTRTHLRVLIDSYPASRTTLTM